MALRDQQEAIIWASAGAGEQSGISIQNTYTTHVSSNIGNSLL